MAGTPASIMAATANNTPSVLLFDFMLVLLKLVLLRQCSHFAQNDSWRIFVSTGPDIY